MAEEVQINSAGTAKIRHPVAVPVLGLITLGIYIIYWWYQVNREMVDLGKARNAEGLGDNPTTSLLAWFPGGLIIVPYFVSLYNGVKRMKRAQELTAGSATLNGWIIVVLYVLGLSVVAIGYMQSELNKAWRTQAGAEIEPGEAGETAQAPPETAPAPPETAPAPPETTPAEGEPPAGS